MSFSLKTHNQLRSNFYIPKEESSFSFIIAILWENFKSEKIIVGEALQRQLHAILQA